MQDSICEMGFKYNINVYYVYIELTIQYRCIKYSSNGVFGHPNESVRFYKYNKFPMVQLTKVTLNAKMPSATQISKSTR